MFYEEIRTKQDLFLHINLLIKYSVQQQLHFTGNSFGNKRCRCNEGSLYIQVEVVACAMTSKMSAQPSHTQSDQDPSLTAKFGFHRAQSSRRVSTWSDQSIRCRRSHADSV